MLKSATAGVSDAYMCAITDVPCRRHQAPPGGASPRHCLHIVMLMLLAVESHREQAGHPGHTADLRLSWW